MSEQPLFKITHESRHWPFCYWAYVLGGPFDGYALIGGAMTLWGARRLIRKVRARRERDGVVWSSGSAPDAGT